MNSWERSFRYDSPNVAVIKIHGVGGGSLGGRRVLPTVVSIIVSSDSTKMRTYSQYILNSHSFSAFENKILPLLF